MSDNNLETVYTRLRPKQRRAIDALLNGEDKITAAAAADVTYRTLDRWHNEPDFAMALNTGGDMAIKGAAVRLKATLNTAIDVFQETMTDKDASTAVRLRAADMVASHALKLLEVAELIPRLEAIEAKLQ